MYEAGLATLLSLFLGFAQPDGSPLTNVQPTWVAGLAAGGRVGDLNLKTFDPFTYGARLGAALRRPGWGLTVFASGTAARPLEERGRLVPREGGLAWDPLPWLTVRGGLLENGFGRAEGVFVSSGPHALDWRGADWRAAAGAVYDLDSGLVDRSGAGLEVRWRFAATGLAVTAGGTLADPSGRLAVDWSRRFGAIRVRAALDWGTVRLSAVALDRNVSYTTGPATLETGGGWARLGRATFTATWGRWGLDLAAGLFRCSEALGGRGDDNLDGSFTRAGVLYALLDRPTGFLRGLVVRADGSRRAAADGGVLSMAAVTASCLFRDGLAAEAGWAARSPDDPALKTKGYVFAGAAWRHAFEW